MKISTIKKKHIKAFEEEYYPNYLDRMDHYQSVMKALVETSTEMSDVGIKKRDAILMFTNYLERTDPKFIKYCIKKGYRRALKNFDEILSMALFEN